MQVGYADQKKWPKDVAYCLDLGNKKILIGQWICFPRWKWILQTSYSTNQYGTKAPELLLFIKLFGATMMDMSKNTFKRGI